MRQTVRLPVGVPARYRGGIPDIFIPRIDPRFGYLDSDSAG